MRTRIAEILSVVRGPAVLHIGCAGGLQSDHPPIDAPHWVHRHLLDSHPDVWGIDLEESRLQALAARGVPNLYVADAETFELGRTFDTIVAGEVIEHLGNPKLFLECARRHLAPEGRIVLTTPFVHGLANILYAWAKYPRTCQNPEHTLWFCPTTLARLGQLARLEVTESRLIEDYPAGSVAKRYRLIRLAYLAVRGLMPQRIRSNCMLLVMEPVQA